jgi:predicted small lipoprotein YifL
MARDVAVQSVKIAPRERQRQETQSMRASRLFSHAVLAGVLVASVGLSACGRKGPLEPPPGAVTDAQPGAGQAAGAQATGAEGGPPQTAPTGAPATAPAGAQPQNSFFLDFLL